jgi:CRP/FNR family transcriptional regulator
MTQITNSKQSVSPRKMPFISSAIAAHPIPKIRPDLQKTAFIDCRLQNLCLAKNLSGNGLRQLDRIVKAAISLKAGKHLYRQEDDFKSLYFIRSGFVKSYITNADGDELAVSFYMPGEVIGLDGLYAKQHMSSMVALQDASICEIPYDALEKLCAAQPILQKRFNELQSRQIVHEQEMTMLRGQKTAASRLIAFLLNMSKRYEELKLSPVCFRLPMTRKDIGSCLGLTLETVSRLFTQLQEQELLRVKGREVTLTNLRVSGTVCH